MKWKLIFQLSVFGLIMAFATVSLIPEKVEPVFWLVIFAFSAYVIAKVCNGKYFLHGFMVSIVNSVWITAIHILAYKSYVAHHADMAVMAEKMPYSTHPRYLMLILAPFFGIAFGLVLGLFSYIASKIVTKKVAIQ
jgi:hypothetical protein